MSLPMFTQPSIRIAQALADRLSQVTAQQYGAGIYTVSPITYGAANDVYVTVALAAGGANSVQAIIDVHAVAAPASGAVDSLGLVQYVYTPHEIDVLFDKNATTPTPESLKFIVDQTVCRFGTMVAWFEADGGVGNIAVSGIIAANLVVGPLAADFEFGQLASV